MKDPVIPEICGHAHFSIGTLYYKSHNTSGSTQNQINLVVVMKRLPATCVNHITPIITINLSHNITGVVCIYDRSISNIHMHVVFLHLCECAKLCVLVAMYLYIGEK